MAELVLFLSFGVYAILQAIMGDSYFVYREFKAVLLVCLLVSTDQIEHAWKVVCISDLRSGRRFQAFDYAVIMTTNLRNIPN